MVRIGSALFNADHGWLEDELRRVESAGVDFIHWDVFDGHFVPDMAFPPRTIKTLRPKTNLPFEVHLAANDPFRLIKPLAEAGTDLLFLPAESTPLLYEAVYTVREAGMKAGLCLALGTPLTVLQPVLSMLDSVLLLGRVTGEGSRGRDFNDLVLRRVETVARWAVEERLRLDIQAAGGLEFDSCGAAVRAGATSLPLGGLLHRQSDVKGFIASLRASLNPVTPPSAARASIGRPRVLVASRSFGKNVPEVLNQLREAGCDLVLDAFQGTPTEEQLLARIGDADALVSGTEPVTERVLAAAPALKVISKHGVGYDNIDVDAARKRKIPVCVAGGSITDSVADMAMGLLLSAARQIARGDRAVRAGRWDRLVGTELRGATLGIVGLGAIGKGVALRAQAFGMRCIAHDAFKDERWARRNGVVFVDLETLVQKADFISLHAPLTPETRGMFSTEQFGRMKPGACLINTARGELVDETALYAALKEGRIASAASDVFHVEPPHGSPLLTLENFTATPHLAGQTHEGLAKMGRITAENLLRVLRGEPPLFQV